MALPMADSAMGRVIRTGAAWTVTDIDDHADEMSTEAIRARRGKMSRLSRSFRSRAAASASAR